MVATTARGRCLRCDGRGGWEGWPGFTCYACGGTGQARQRERPTRPAHTANPAPFIRACPACGVWGPGFDTAHCQEGKDGHAVCPVPRGE